MDLSKILSISGKSGLFKVVSQLKNAVLVESLIDKKRFPAFAHDKISSLQEISVFTTSEDKPLKEILKAMYEKLDAKPARDVKADPKVISSFFLEIVPDYDTERVYISDIKKILNWYNLLLENNMLDFSEPEEEKQDGTGTEEKEGSKEIKESVEKKKKTTKKKSENPVKQAKPTSSRSVKKSEHRSMNSK
jgi:hypothetical protein